MAITSITVDIWSDVVCPWCYIGKRRFESAVAELADEFAVDVRYHAYQLDPNAAPGVATPMPEVYARKFGGREIARQMIDRITGVAAETCLELRLDIAVRANTLLAHRLIWLAAQPGSPADAAQMNDRLMRAYFSEGRNIGDPDTLAELAADVGFGRAEVRDWLDTTAGQAEVAADLERAADHDITAVPTFVIDDRWAVPGAQDPETFLNVLRRVRDNAAAG